MDLEAFYSPDKVKKKSSNQEKRIAREVGGNTTIASGALSFQKGDVTNKKLRLRIEAKRTDKSRIILEKGWLEKITHESRFEIPVLNIEIQDQNWYLVRPQEFGLILESLGLDEGG